MNGCADFGSQLRKLRPDWWQFNLNYDELNKRLVEVKREFGLRKALSSRSLTGETRTFAEILDQDVEKIVMFYLRAQGDIGQCNFTSVVVVRLLLLTHEFSFWTPATRLWEMRQRQILNLEGFNLSVEQIEIMCQKYRDLGQVSANKHIFNYQSDYYLYVCTNFLIRYWLFIIICALPYHVLSTSQCIWFMSLFSRFVLSVNFYWEAY